MHANTIPVIKTTKAKAMVAANIIPRLGKNSRHFGEKEYTSQGTGTNNIHAGFKMTRYVINGTSCPRLTK